MPENRTAPEWLVLRPRRRSYAHHYGKTPAFVLLGDSSRTSLLAEQAPFTLERPISTDRSTSRSSLARPTRGGSRTRSRTQSSRSTAPVWRWLWDDGGTRAVREIRVPIHLDGAPAEQPSDSMIASPSGRSTSEAPVRHQRLASSRIAGEGRRSPVRSPAASRRTFRFSSCQGERGRERTRAERLVRHRPSWLHNNLGGPMQQRRTRELFSGSSRFYPHRPG